MMREQNHVYRDDHINSAKFKPLVFGSRELYTWFFALLMSVSGIIFAAALILTDQVNEQTPVTISKTLHHFLFTAMAAWYILSGICVKKHRTKLLVSLSLLSFTPFFNLVVYIISRGDKSARGVFPYIDSSIYNFISVSINTVGSLLFLLICIHHVFFVKNESI